MEVDYTGELESGFVGDAEASGIPHGTMTDIKVLATGCRGVKARGRRYGRLWFLKGPGPELAASAGELRRLMKEFGILMRLHHPAVVQAVGVEEFVGAGVCLVLEWVEGRTLREALRGEGMPQGERRRIMREVIEAVAYLHGCGVVHRDLKPSNIMLRSVGGEVVIVDFGLADTADYVELKQGAGTRGFISPEQMAEGGADPSDDVYSLGVIMRELCPEYAALARRCTAARGVRPSDGRELLKEFNRRVRLPRTVARWVGGMVLAGAAAVAGGMIWQLRHSAGEAQMRLEAVVADNLRSAATVHALTDSLSRVNLRLAEADDYRMRTEAYASARKAAFRKGCGIIDAMLERYDREVFQKLDPAVPVGFTDSLTVLQGNLNAAIDRYCSTLPDDVPQGEDREKMRLDLISYYAKTFTDYNDRWLKKFFPERN